MRTSIKKMKPFVVHFTVRRLVADKDIAIVFAENDSEARAKLINFLRDSHTGLLVYEEPLDRFPEAGEVEVTIQSVEEFTGTVFTKESYRYPDGLAHPLSVSAPIFNTRDPGAKRIKVYAISFDIKHMYDRRHHYNEDVAIVFAKNINEARANLIEHIRHLYAGRKVVHDGAISKEYRPGESTIYIRMNNEVFIGTVFTKKNGHNGQPNFGS